MSKPIWIVEQGEYSDYTVVGIFSTKENAERIRDIINDSKPYYKAEVEEWKLDPHISEIMEEWVLYHVKMLYDGTTESVERSSTENIKFVGLKVCGGAKWSQHKKTKSDDFVSGRVWARDDKHAVKIANEFRIQAKAEGLMQTYKEYEDGLL